MTPKEASSPAHPEKQAARETFKAARTEWRDTKARIRQIKAEIEAGAASGAERSALVAEKKRLKAGLPEMGAKVRSTKAAWQKLKDEARPADAE